MTGLMPLLPMLAVLAGDPAAAQPDYAFDAYRASIAAAEKSLRLGETRELRRWLAACPPALRGWEWRHLEAIADTSLRRETMPQTPLRVVMSPAGDRLATVEGSTVRVLAWPGLDEIAVIDGHGDAVYRAEFSAGGGRLITVSRDVTARTWDLASGAEIARHDLANPAFAAVAFDPAGASAATCAWDRDESGQVHGVVWVWDPATGEVTQRKRVGVKPLSSIRFTPDGTRIVTGSWDGLVHVLDTAADEVQRLALPDEGIYNAVNDVSISPDGRLVAAASKDRTTRIFALDSGELVASLRGHGGYVEGVAFSPEGTLLATCSVDATVMLWRTGDWARERVLRGAIDTVRGAAWTLDGTSIVAGALDGALWVWDADVNDDAAVEIRVEAEGIYSTALSPDGAVAAVACYNGWLRLFDTRSGAQRLAWEAHPGSTCHAAAFNADGRRLVTGSWDRTARVWDPGSGREIAQLDTQDGVYAVAISPDGARVAASGDAIHVWDVDGRERLCRIAVEGAGPRRLAFSSDGVLLASGWSDGFARIHESRDGALVATLGGGDAGIETVAFAPGDAAVVTGDAKGVVRLVPVAGGDPLFAVDTGGRSVNQVACSGDRIAVATDQLWLLDAARGELVLGMSPHADTIWHLDWSADGERLATCAAQGVIRILESDPRSASSDQ